MPFWRLQRRLGRYCVCSSSPNSTVRAAVTRAYWEGGARRTYITIINGYYYRSARAAWIWSFVPDGGCIVFLFLNLMIEPPHDTKIRRPTLACSLLITTIYCGFLYLLDLAFYKVDGPKYKVHR